MALIGVDMKGDKPVHTGNAGIPHEAGFEIGKV
jgi:hypothetical protein